MDELSWNYRIHPLAAVLSLADLEVAPQRVTDRRQALDSAHEAIEHIPGLLPVHCYPGDLSAAYRIPLTFDSQKVGEIPRDEFIEALHGQGVEVEAGPVRIPVHLRQVFGERKTSWGRITSHLSHLKGSCVVAERRCEKTELVVSRHGCEKH
jgi:dTDP-4-amino-4,6-dideoxygalactose transaminase